MWTLRRSTMSDLEKIASFVSAARVAYDAFGEAVGDEGEVVREGRTIRYAIKI